MLKNKRSIIYFLITATIVFMVVYGLFFLEIREPARVICDPANLNDPCPQYNSYTLVEYIMSKFK